MNELSVLFPITPENYPLLYSQGNAAGWLARQDKTAAAPYHLSGRLYLSKSGWLLLSVPNAFVRGLFDALTVPGAELPTDAVWGMNNNEPALNAHISVMNSDEVEGIGADKINERGHHFHYALGPLKEITPKGDSLSRVWIVQVSSPELSALRKGYGLTPLLNDDHPFHITVAVRRKNVLGNNTVSRFDVAGGRGELKAASDCGDIAQPGERGVCNAEVVGSSPSISTKKELPWRERVEVYTRHPQTGQIYGGKWLGDKSFAVPGGGIDPGETPEQAAIRELAEETGIQAANPVRLPIPHIDHPWSDEVRAEKAKIGRGEFAGSRTHFVMADFVKKLRNKQLDKWDASARRFYDPSKALAMMEGKQFMAPAVATGRMTALKHIIEQAAKKQAAEILHGGLADNKPDSDFSPTTLAQGKQHEHEHTGNDQIAKEIAKDHLQEDPGYYKKIEQIEGEVKRADTPVVNKEPSIILQLRAAKAHSDARRYRQKSEILRRLMHRAPEDWMVDDPDKYHMGITHLPTRFKFHADPQIIPVGVPVQKAAGQNPYLSQLFNLDLQNNVPANATIGQRIYSQFQQAKSRGDWKINADHNAQNLFAAMDPKYKLQRNMALARGEWAKPDMLTQTIQNHGDALLKAFA